MRVDDKIEVRVRALGSSGEGVATHEEMVVFVDGALPGERVAIRVTETKRSYAKAILEKILEASPDRVEPLCPVFGQCGGCQWMHLAYQKQLEAKRQRVVDALTRIGKLPDPQVEPCIASPRALGYRNKIQMPMSSEGLGLYARSSHTLVPISDCAIHCDLGEGVVAAAGRILKEKGIVLRHLLVKSAVHKGQVLVVFVSDGCMEGLQAAAEALMQICPEVRGVVENINPRSDNVILGDVYRTLAGASSIQERLAGKTFSISAASFFQVNPWQAEALYEEALRLAELDKTKTVLDAFCGVGTLSILAAAQAGCVIGIECVSEAIADARSNAALNGVENAQFVCARAEEEVLPRADVTLLNPPRKGCEASLLKKLTAPTLIYISCDPATLSRDLQLLSIGGYRLDHAQPFDMFPQTTHVETVVRLRKIS